MAKDQSHYACYVFERQWISNLIKNTAIQISIQLELHEGWFLALHLFRDYCCVAKFASSPGVRCSHSWIDPCGTGAWLGSLRLAHHFLCFVEIIPSRNESTCKTLGQHSQETRIRISILPAPNPRLVLHSVTAKISLVLTILLLVETCSRFVPAHAMAQTTCLCDTLYWHATGELVS